MSDSAPDPPQSSVLSCSECGHENPAEVNFCTKCRAKMTLECNKCGFKSPQGSEFCGSCGEDTEFRVEKMARNAAAEARAALIPCKTYFPNGQLFEKGFKKPDLAVRHDEHPTDTDSMGDEWDGPYESYYENGQLWAKGTFVAGELDGPAELYHENGQLWAKGTYRVGQKDGPAELYHENGQLWEKGTYVAGAADGPFEYYYENGQLWEKGTVNRRHRCGEWIEMRGTKSSPARRAVRVTYPPC